MNVLIHSVRATPDMDMQKLSLGMQVGGLAGE